MENGRKQWFFSSILSSLQGSVFSFILNIEEFKETRETKTISGLSIQLSEL